MKHRRYKDTLVAPSSALGQLMANKAGASAIEKHYDETTKTCKKLYGEDNYKWFVEMHRNFPPENRKPVESNQ
jgi:hypothetical protein